ncbi:MAG: flagellar basal body L-ring protein FlgH [Thermodesulfobacteriota bacterium]
MKKRMPLLLPLLCCACVATTPPPQAVTAIPPRLALPEQAARPTPQQEGTIFQVDGADLYRDGRAREVGDIVLIKIVETSSGAKKATTKTARDSKLTGGVASLFGFENWAADHNANFIPSNSNLSTGLKNEFDGSGETKRDSKITATISARVVEKSADGNLIIRGFQETRLNNETQHIILSGLVRPQDILPDNSILSTHVADARIEYAGTGVITDKQRPGWLARGLDLVWPF